MPIALGTQFNGVFQVKIYHKISLFFVSQTKFEMKKCCTFTRFALALNIRTNKLLYVKTRFMHWESLFTPILIMPSHPCFLQFFLNRPASLSMTPSSCLIRVILIYEQAYLWENNEAVVSWLLTQLSEERRDRSVVANNLHCVKKDAIIQQIKSSLEVCCSYCYI